MQNKYCFFLFFLIVASSLTAAGQPQFAVQKSHRDSNGITFRTAAGSMRIEVCGNRVIHVVASPTSEIPIAKVPVVIQPCKAENVQVTSEKNQVKLSTEAMSVTLDTVTGALTFLSKDGNPLLAEPKGGGKAFEVPSVFE